MIFDGDREYIGHYMRFLADKMGLRDWYLEFSHGMPADFDQADARACCAISEPYMRATIAVDDGWEEWGESEFRWIMVHELLHCHLSQLIHTVRCASAPLGELIHGTMMEAAEHALERSIDNMAYNWALHLPLPSEWLEMETAPEEVA